MKAEYYLICKTIGKSFENYRGSAISISESIPHTVDEIWVGVKKHPEKMRKITTFRDKDGNITERAFDFADGKLRNRLYRHDYTKISNDEAVKSTEISEYYIRKRVLPFYYALLEDNKGANLLKTILWNLKEIRTNHFNWNKKADRKVLSQVIISNTEKPTKEQHSFIEFPHIINGKIQKNAKKLLSFIVNRNTGKVANYGIIEEHSKVPVKDSYLALRALNIFEAREPLTRRYLKEHNLQNKNIIIEPYYYPKNEDEKLYNAHFDPDDGSINFNRFKKFYSKTQLAKTSAHEAEHGWQYYLRARYGNPTTDWENEIRNVFGEIKDKKLLKEAKRYYNSIINYTPLTKALKDDGNIDVYKRSYIERQAKKKGEKKAKEYHKEGKEIRKQFKYIPERFL